MDTSVNDQFLKSDPCDLSSYRIESRKNDSLRSIVDDEIYSCQSLDGSDVAAFSSDDAALHVVVRQADYRNRSLCDLIRSISLDRGRDDLSCPLVCLFLCFAFDANDHVGSVLADLCFEFLKEQMFCFFSCVTRDPFEFFYLLLDVGIDLSVLFVHRLLSLGETVLTFLDALELAVDVLFLLLDPSLSLRDLSPPGLEFTFVFFSQLMYFLFCLKHLLFLEVLDSILRIQDHVPGLLFCASYGLFSDILTKYVTNCYTDDKDYNADHNS